MSYAYATRDTGAFIDYDPIIGLYYRLPRAFLSLLADPTDRELLREVLQGDLYQGGTLPGLERLRAEIARVEADPAHPWRAELDENAAKSLASA